MSDAVRLKTQPYSKEEKRIMQELVSEMEKGWNEKIVFSFSTFRGKNYADIRVYYEDDEGEWKPTKKGVAVAVDRFSEFKDCLGELETFIKDGGHLSE
jgi:hypothetical protein